MVKIISFQFNNKEFSCELTEPMRDEDLKEIFRSVAECDSSLCMRLYNSSGNLVPILKNSLLENDKYRLEVTQKSVFHKLFKEIQRTNEQNLVFERFCNIEIDEKLCEQIKYPNFNNWKFTIEEMLALLRQMFTNLNLISMFRVNIQTLNEFLFEVYLHYNDVPFHNFKHAFVVSQMMYSLVHLMKLEQLFDSIEILSLMISALCHDLNHDGFNNSYQINTCSALAILYNDKSPLEMYHCAVAFSILIKEKCNILVGLSKEQFKRLRENVIECILATDMAYHKELLQKFESIREQFDYKNREHILILMKILMKTADISNECRPLNVSEEWLNCLLQEFFIQGDHEKQNGLSISPLMDRETCSKSSSQLGFINYVLLPLVTSLEKLFPQIHEYIVLPINESLEYYKKLSNQ